MFIDSGVLYETRYARSGDLSIAYQVIGDGPRDLIYVPGIVSHVEFSHELPGYTEFLNGLASFARVILRQAWQRAVRSYCGCTHHRREGR